MTLSSQFTPAVGWRFKSANVSCVADAISSCFMSGPFETGLRVGESALCLASDRAPMRSTAPTYRAVLQGGVRPWASLGGQAAVGGFSFREEVTHTPNSGGGLSAHQ
jgi:hypothetical protein